MTTCQIPDCARPVYVKSRGWCRLHYSRWHRHGDPLVETAARVIGDSLGRWFSKVRTDDPDGHWIWTGALDRHGYGQFDVTTDGVRKNHRAHRWGYQQLVRPLGVKETLDHVCRVHACVNPAHLEPVTHAVNVARGESGKHNADKTHCSKGHEFTPENTRQRATGGRACKECARVASREAMRARRGTAPDAVRNRDKTHCKNGHEFTPENTRLPKRGGRECIRCHQESTLRSLQRRLTD